MMLPNLPLEDQGAAFGGAGSATPPPPLAHYTSGPFAAAGSATRPQTATQAPEPHRGIPDRLHDGQRRR